MQMRRRREHRWSRHRQLHARERERKRAGGPAGAVALDIPGSTKSGSAYDVTVKAQPAGRPCVVYRNAGTVTDANVTNVGVSCGGGNCVVLDGVRWCKDDELPSAP
jgi:hypothetical protein